MSGPRLTLADQALANALGFVAVQSIEDARTDLVLAELPDLLPAASSQITVMARLVAAGVEVMACAPRRRDPAHSAAWCAAQLSLRAACADFLFWRGGLAIDALRNATSTPSTAGAAA